MPDAERQAALGLGGNVGDVAATLATALKELDASDGISLSAVSSLYRTPPWGKTDQPWFVNACALVETRLTPEALLDRCLEIERLLKRDRSRDERWGPRRIDIDILTFGDLAIGTERLTVPHPRMTERGFVMLPLAEIAPDLTIRGRTAAAWAGTVAADGIERRGERGWWR